MRAVRGNKEYVINESQKKHYIDRGYDIRGDDNAVIAYGRGKTVPYDEYEKAVRENNDLKEQLSVENSMRKGRASEENKALRENMEELQEENKALRENMEELQEENQALREKMADMAADTSDTGSTDTGRAKTPGKNKAKEDAAAGQG